MTDAPDELELTNWLREQTWSEFAQSLAAFHLNRGYLSERQLASARKMYATCQARAATTVVAEVPVVNDGYEPAKNDVHVIDGDFYRIHKSQNGEFFYGAVWDGEHFVGPRYDDRAKGLLHRVSKATLASAEQAAAFGHANEVCCFCSIPIDTPESKAVGYGPKCAANRGLPWGTVTSWKDWSDAGPYPPDPDVGLVGSGLA